MQYREKIEQKSDFKILTCAICIYYRYNNIDLLVIITQIKKSLQKNS